MCPRFLFVDTIKCAHEDHDLRLPTLREDGQNWTLTDRVLLVMRCIYNHGQNEAIPAIRSMQNLRVTNYLHIITKKKPVTFRRQVKDISDGGFCLLANHAPKQSALLQGQLRLPKMPAQIPTLVQVRWIRPTVPTALPHRPAIRDLKDARLRLAKVIRQVKTSLQY